jgi:hypothetical protein
VAVTYYDTRNNTAAPGLLTDLWAVFANPRDRHNAPGGLANPANWGDEIRLTPHSFDIEQAPRSTNENNGYFLGDYQGLVAVGDRFVAFFSVAGTGGPSTAGIYSRLFAPERGADDEFLAPYVGDDGSPGHHRYDGWWG